MQPVDKFLISNFPTDNWKSCKFQLKDQKIFASFYNQLTSGLFLTERQATLLHSILTNNKKFMIDEGIDVSPLDADPIWSDQFRKIKKIREIFLEGDCIVVKINHYDSQLQNLIYSIKLPDSSIVRDVSTYKMQLSENNLFAIVTALKDLDFNIDPKIMQFYNEISNIHVSNNTYFDIFNIADLNIKSAITSDIGNISEDNLLLLHDRKLRFGYTVSKSLDNSSLAAKIANRGGPKVFIDSTRVTLSDLIAALNILNRLPLLIEFDNNTANKKTLNEVVDSLAANNLLSSVGIYFRLEKDTSLGFNETIAEHSLNAALTDRTLVAGIRNTKLPKFMVSNTWRPKSILSFSKSSLPNKAAVYAADTDLIIFYGVSTPFKNNFGDIHAIM